LGTGVYLILEGVVWGLSGFYCVWQAKLFSFPNSSIILMIALTDYG